MEPTNQVANLPLKKGVSTGLIIALIVILIGGGIGLFFVLKPKNGNDNTDTEGTDDSTDTGAEGRDISSHYAQLTPAQIAALMASYKQDPPPSGKPGSSANNPLYYKSNQAEELVAKTAQDMQRDAPSMDIIRSKYDIGKTMVGRNDDEGECIDELFSKLSEVDLTSDPDRRYLSYPVYGTFERDGPLYRAELQNIIDSGWEGLNLTRLRDSDKPWWCEKIGLNLLVGTTVSTTPTVHNTWMSFAPRTELDFFKRFNHHWVADQHLAEKFVDKRNSQRVVLSAADPNARAAYCAGNMYQFVLRWIGEIDRLDEVTRAEAFKFLSQPDENGNRWYFTYINPDTGEDEENTSKNPFNLDASQKGRGGP